MLSRFSRFASTESTGSAAARPRYEAYTPEPSSKKWLWLALGTGAAVYFYRRHSQKKKLQQAEAEKKALDELNHIRSSAAAAAAQTASKQVVETKPVEQQAAPVPEIPSPDLGGVRFVLVAKIGKLILWLV